VKRGDNRRRRRQEERVDAYQSLRQQLMQRLAHLEGRLDTVEHDRRRGTNTLDPDWEEQATVRQHDEVFDELAEEERRQARAIRAALQRREEGSYGQCVTCGEPIAPRRLAALPYATQCIVCVRRAEHQGRAGR
jgi:RNA polymerase-binding transcription factor DksA